MNPVSWPELSAAAFDRLDRCERLFELADLRRLPWPALDPEAPGPDTGPRLELGEAFHRLAHLQALGLETLPTAFTGWEQAEALAAMWHYFREAPVSEVRASTWSEYPLHLVLGSLRWTVRFDRLVREPDGRWLLLDWKTGPAFDHATAEVSWQTRLYRFSLAYGGAAFNGGASIPADHITLIYWHVPTGEGFAFPYSQALMDDDRRAIAHLAARVTQGLADGFPESPDQCPRCRFRTLCRRASHDDNAVGSSSLPVPSFLFPE